MKSISEFLSGCLFVSLIAPVCANASECTDDCINFRTEITVKLPCGCDNHVCCLRLKAEKGGYKRGGDKYRCLNPKCPNQQQGKFENAETFWKFMWKHCPIDKGANWEEQIWEPICTHKTPWYVSENYWCWLKNRDNGKDNHNWWNPINLANASKAYNTERLCAICGTGKRW